MKGELPNWDRIAFDLIVRAAERGDRAPTATDIQEAVGCNSVSSTVNIVQRLERRGLIRVERHQVARRITVVETGKSTAPVNNTAPHWRARPRPRSMPSVAPSMVQQRKPDLAREMMVAARHEGLSFQDFLMDLVWIGWSVRQAEIQSNTVTA